MDEHSDNSQSCAVPLILKQPLFKHNLLKSIKLKYFLLSIQKIVKVQLGPVPFNAKSLLLPSSKGQLSLTIKLDFQHIQEMLGTKTLIWALTNLQLLKHMGMIASSCIYNLIGTLSLAVVASKKRKNCTFLVHALQNNVYE